MIADEKEKLHTVNLGSTTIKYKPSYTIHEDGCIEFTDNVKMSDLHVCMKICIKYLWYIDISEKLLSQ